MREFEQTATWQLVTEHNVLRKDGSGEQVIQVVCKGVDAMEAVGEGSEMDLFCGSSKKRLPDAKTWVAGR